MYEATFLYIPLKCMHAHMCRHVRASRSLPALFDGSLQLCSLLASSQVGWLEIGSSNVFHGFTGSSVKNPLSTSSLVNFVSSR